MCVSYSGETEETLACARQAHRQGADILIVAAGGTLVSLAQEWGSPTPQVPDAVATGQPRAALGYLFGAMAGAFGACRPRVRGDRLGGRGGRGGRSTAAAARELGERLATTIPLIYGAGPIGAVAYRWKTQLNENAKMHAFSHALPELAHNEIVGWEGALPGRFAAVLLSDPGQDDAVRTQHRRRPPTLIAAEAAWSRSSRPAATRRPRGPSRWWPRATGRATGRRCGAASTRRRCATSTCSSRPCALTPPRRGPAPFCGLDLDAVSPAI